MDIDIIRGKLGSAGIMFSQNRQKLPNEVIKNLPGSSLGDTDKKAEYVKNTDYLIDAIAKLKHAGDVFNRRLDFKVDKDTNRIIVKVIDTKTDKVIKEIPPEQLIELAAKIQELIGLLVDEER